MASRSRLTPPGTIIDPWFVVEIAFSYQIGAEGTPGGIGPLHEVIVSGEKVPKGGTVTRSYTLPKVTLATEEPTPPEDTGLPPDLIRVGVPLRFWNPGTKNLIGFWELERLVGYPRRLRSIDCFKIAEDQSALTMRHIGSASAGRGPAAPLWPCCGSEQSAVQVGWSWRCFIRTPRSLRDAKPPATPPQALRARARGSR